MQNATKMAGYRLEAAPLLNLTGLAEEEEDDDDDDDDDDCDDEVVVL
jgi:hypothetical protein